jgi:hypothetical protein
MLDFAVSAEALQENEFLLHRLPINSFVVIGQELKMCISSHSLVNCSHMQGMLNWTVRLLETGGIPTYV